MPETTHTHRVHALAWEFVLVLGLAMAGLGACQSSLPAALESITIGNVQAEPWQIDVARDQDLFTQNGLEVTSKLYGSGGEIAQALVNREVDLGEIGEYDLVVQALQQAPLQILATVEKTETIYLVGRKDHGIARVADLRGKRIALPRNGLPEFYLGRMLDLNGLSIRDVTLVDSALQSVDRLGNGDVDAMVTTFFYTDQLRDKLRDQAAVWSVQSNQSAYVLLVGQTEWVRSHPDAVTRFLRVMDQANQFLADHPAEAKPVVQKALQADDVFVTQAWPLHRFGLSLDQALVLAMEDEARWMIRNNVQPGAQVPNFLDYIYLDGLEAVKPDAMYIIH